jgi:hypothetical protein
MFAIHRSVAPWACLVLTVASGCDDDFAPRTKLEGYRVLGIEASPPEATPDDVVLFTAHDFHDEDRVDEPDQVDYRWSVCLYGQGALDGFDCTAHDLELEFGDTRTAELDMAALGFRTQLDEMGPVADLDGQPRSLERGFDVWVMLESGPSCAGCSIRTAKRLRLRESAESANKNPVIESLRVIGGAVGATTVRLRVDVSNAETYVDSDTGERLTEEYLYTWYSSAGETDPPLTFGDTRETELHLAEGDPTTTVAVAIRDGRGGFTVQSVVIER